MRKEKYAPTIVHDLRALGDLYATVLVMMARRLTRRDPRPQAAYYGPFEIVRPRELDEREEADA